VDLIVEAFSRMPEKKLVVIGAGPEFSRIKASAGHNVDFLGYQPGEVLRDHMQRARAFVFAAEEDFGIAPLEAQACGTPVIAYGKGGALETIRGEESVEPTGVFFGHQDVESLLAALKKFEKVTDGISPISCRNNALRFSPQVFRERFRVFIDQELRLFENSQNKSFAQRSREMVQ
jgi:glycosyltransferase involved in cell wall biosynthesis